MKKLMLKTEEYQAIALEVKTYHNKIKRHTKKDVDLIIKAYKSGDWTEVHATKLYNTHGGNYCSLLEVLYSLGYTR